MCVCRFVCMCGDALILYHANPCLNPNLFPMPVSWDTEQHLDISQVHHPFNYALSTLDVPINIGLEFYLQ